MIAIFALFLPMTVLAPPAGAATRWPMPSSSGLRSAFDSAWAFLTDYRPPTPWTPVQPGGTAAGRPHEVSAAATRASRGRGHAPGKGPGQLPAYQALPPKVLKGLSGHGVTGYNARTSRFLSSKSSATATVFQNADGSFTKRIGAAPLNFRTASGTWQPISTTLVKQGGRWGQQANSDGVSFAPAGTSGNLTAVVPAAGESASLGLAGAAPARPVVSKSSITYPGILPGTDLLAYSTSVGAQQALVLHSAATSSWILPLDLHGLRPVMAAGGAVDLVNESGTVVAFIPEGYAQDSKISLPSGERATTDSVSYALVTYHGAAALRVTLDQAWLRDPARVFPVTVSMATLQVAGPGSAAPQPQPARNTASLTASYTSNESAITTYTETENPGDHSTEETIKVGSYDAGTHDANSFLQFPGTGLDGSKITVSSAVLSLWDVWASTCTAEPFNVAQVTSAWTPSGVTTYPGPSYSSTSIGSATPTVTAACGNTSGNMATGNTVNVTLTTSAIQAWANGTTKDYGLALYASTTDDLHWKQFGSDYNPYGSPELTVTYTAGNLLPAVVSQQPADQTVENTLTPTLSAVGSIDATLGKTVELDFQVYNTSGTKIVDSGAVKNVEGATNIGEASYTVPSGDLTWDTQYYWTVQAYDGTNYSPGPVFNSMSVQVPQPAVTSLLSQNDGGHGFDPSIGNYTTSATDANVATVGPSLSVVRDYNSLDPRITGAFGAAWSSVFDSRVTVLSSSVVVTYPDGSEVGFGKNSDGSYTAPEGRFATLKSVTGGYTLTDKNDTLYTFTKSLGTINGSAVYGISSITDALSRAVTFTWTTASPYEITAMTSGTSNRALHITWSTPSGAKDPHITSVATDDAVANTSATAETWTYGYTKDQLTSVCPPANADGKCTGYAYQANGSDLHSEILDEAPQSYWPLNEASGATTAASAVVANEGTDDGTYSNVTLGTADGLPGATDTVATFNGTSSYVHLPPLHLYDNDSETVSLWFKTSTASGVLFAAQDEPIGTSATKGNFNPVLYVGKDGKLNGLLWQQMTVAPIVSSAAVDDGKWHHVVIAGSPSAQTMWLDGVQQGTTAGATSIGITDTRPWLLAQTYVGTGYIGAYYPDNTYTNNSTLYPEYFNGTIADVAYFNRALTQQDVSTIYNAGTIPASLLSKITQPLGGQYAGVSYDPNTTRVTQVTDENGGTWKLGAPTTSGSSDVYRAAVLGAGPQDYWRLGDSAGAVRAANEVNGGTATYNSVTLGAAGPFSDHTAASFNGATPSYLSLPVSDTAISGPGSIGLWFKTTGKDEVLYAAENGPLSGTTGPSSYTPALYIGTDGKLNASFWVNDLSDEMTSSAAVNDGKWHYVVLHTTGSSEAVDLDGERIGYYAIKLAASTVTNVVVGDGWMGGKWPDIPSTTPAMYPFTGTIAEVAWYNSNLSDNQIADQWEASKSSAGLSPVVSVKVTDPGNHTLTYEYDPLNSDRQIAYTDGLGHKTSYGYDTSGYLYTTTDPDGNVTTTGHDPRGNVVSTTTCQDQAASECSTVYQTYYPDDTSTSLTTADPRNDQVLTVSDGRSASASDTTYRTTYTYDTSGDVTGVTTPPVPGFPTGRTTAVTYSDGTSTYPATNGGNVPKGLPVKIVSPGGSAQAIGYDSEGDVTSTQNADGLVTDYTYDLLGRVIKKTEISNSYPDGLVTTYAYDLENRVTAETDPTITDQVTGAVHTAQTTTTYDDDGNVTQQDVSDTTGGDTTRSVKNVYNLLDQLTSTTDAAGDTTSYTYDPYGNKLTQTDADNDETTYAYDPDGNLLTTTLDNYTGDPVSPSAPVSLIEDSRAYDPAGRLASDTDSLGNVTSYTYTGNGLLATVIRKNKAGTSSYTEESDTYDAAGNLIQKVTDNGATTTNYTVDAADRVASTVEDPAGLDRVTTTTYTPDDKPATVTQATGTGTASQVTSYTYDAMGNETSQSVAQPGAGGPAGWWQLNQASGTSVPDASGRGNTATAAGVTWNGSAATLAGTYGQGITTSGPVLDTTGSFTVAAWVNLTGTTTSQTVISQDAGTDSGFYLKYYPDNGDWDFMRPQTDTTDPTSSNAFSSSAAATGTWTFLTGTYDAQTGDMTLYVNGTAVGTSTDPDPIAANGPLAIGRSKWDGNPTDWFDGSIAGVQAYQRTLTAAQVQALYQLGQNGGTSTTGELTTTWQLDQRGLPTSMTDPDGNTTTYAYDEAGNEAEVSAPAVTTEVYNPATATDTPVTANPVTYFGYDTFGEKTEVKDPDGNVTTYGYDGDGHQTSETLPPYTPPGGTASVTQPTVSTYDGDGNLASSTDPLGNETTYTYDQLGDQATEVTPGPDGGTTHDTYDTDGEQLTSTGPTGAESEETYDWMGREATSTVMERYPSSAAYTTNYSYASSAGDPGGTWLSGTVSPAGVSTAYTYDALGEQLSMTDGAGDVTSYGYDYLGRQDSVTAPNGAEQLTTYDAQGDPVQVQQEDKTGTLVLTRNATYDDDGNMLSSTDANRNTTTFAYDATGLLTQEVQPVSASSSITTSFGYDAAGNQTRYTDGNQNAWYTTYNSWNLPESKVEPATSMYSSAADSTFTMAYDADGREAAYTQPGGVTVSYGYDAEGNLQQETGSGADAPTAAQSFTYDQAGDMLTADTSAAGSSPATSEAFTYNDRGEVLTASGSAGSTSMSYTSDGLLASVTDAAGTTSYSYDDADRLSGLSDPATGASLTYGYTSDELTSVSYGSGGDTRTYGYDGLGRLTSDTLAAPGGTTLASITYGYDANGNLTSKDTAGTAGAADNTYTYDEANRLTSWDNGTTTTDYGYDADGNRTQVGAATYAYDARDELTSDGTSTYSYTARGTLSATTTGTTTAAATADALGQQATDGTQSYGYDALGRLLTVTPASGTATTLSYSGASGTLASDGTSTYSWTPDGSLVGIGTAGGTTASGVLAMTDQHTDVVGDFTPDGTSLSGSTAYDPLGNVITTSGTPQGNLGYQSAFTDPATGKALMGSRWYDPGTGQFTSRDTQSNSAVPNSADANPFAYAAGNPMTGVDPTGHGWWSDVTHAVSSGWHDVTHAVSTGWDYVSSAVSTAWDYTTSALDSAFDAIDRELNAELAAINREFDEEMAALDRQIAEENQEIYDMAHRARSLVTHVIHRVVHVARKVVSTTVSLVRTGYHEVKQVAKTGAEWVENHKAAIVSFAASTATFIGCEALTAPETAGLSTVGCAAAAGAVGNAVSYSMSCGSSAGGCSVTGALISSGEGAAAGALGGALLGPLGGKVAAEALSEVLPAVAARGIVGTVAGALSGAAGGALDYGVGCAQGGNCSLSGLGSAAAGGAAGGAVFGAIGGALDPGLTKGGEATGEEPTSAGCGQSFAAATLVVLASGAAIPISRLKAGEQVKAVNTKTGESDVKTVQAVLVKWDTDLYDLTVKTAHGSEVIDTTSSHLFWDPASRKWVKASALKKGEHLKTDDGQDATADGGHTPADHDGWMWDLTIQGDHDFYVLPALGTDSSTYYYVDEHGVTAVLVHNCDDAKLLQMAEDNAQMATRYQSRAGSNWDVQNKTSAVVSARFPTGDSDNPWVIRTVVAASGEGMSMGQLSFAAEMGHIPVEDNLPGTTHAEQNALLAINRMGGIPLAGGASRSVCDAICGALIDQTSGAVTGRVYPSEAGRQIRTFYWPGSLTP
ncbi:MAG TPA: LamG-like jellyroll fold domain-containing protein [Trebonia sp.]|nr:LamG-like jellyroll fold domain-containing protein [Trebonia sp.]